ncbi:MAG: nucleotidyltransferase domain-containing protein [Rickettsiaceae bacterium]|nr:nucleotidyltransferase domain-containing protein [Rickettsiaceae bacterium]
MILNIEEKHLVIVNNILKKYDYSFFVFGSRITAKVKKLSDLDLLYFDNIPTGEIIKLEEEFEESDLPYKVDLVNYNQCDEDFKKTIGKNYLCLQNSSRMSRI